jgi:hypothetical protein
MISDCSELICPAIRPLIHRIIQFSDLNDLYAKLNVSLTDSANTELTVLAKPSPPSRSLTTEKAVLEDPLVPVDTVDTIGAVDTVEASREAPLEDAAEEIEGDDKQKALSQEEAAARIATAWRNYRAKQRIFQQSKLSEEGQIYEQFRSFFAILSKKGGKRDGLLQRQIRGPCLSIVIALRILVQELDERLEDLDDALQAPGDLRPKALAEIQKGIDRDRKFAK